MKQLVLVLLLVGLGVLAYLHFRADPPEPAPEPKAPRLAQQGTFFVLNYVSVPTAHGVIGFEPGREVHFVRADRQKGTLIVSDGQYEVELKPNQLTNDLDIAALARKGDEDSQHQISAFLDHERVVYERATREENLRYAQEVERLNALKKTVGVGRSVPATPPPGNSNPYAYLYPAGGAPH